MEDEAVNPSSADAGFGESICKDSARWANRLPRGLPAENPADRTRFCTQAPAKLGQTVLRTGFRNPGSSITVFESLQRCACPAAVIIQHRRDLLNDASEGDP